MNQLEDPHYATDTLATRSIDDQGGLPDKIVIRHATGFRLGTEQRVCGPGDVVVIPGGTEHEAWVREDTEVIDFFAPPRDDFLLGGKPAYMS